MNDETRAAVLRLEMQRLAGAIESASSTERYLADHAASRPWVNPAAVPLHIVKRIETYNDVRRNRFVTASFDPSMTITGRSTNFAQRVDPIDTDEFVSLGQ